MAVGGNFLEFGEVEPLYLVADTDLYFRSYQLTPASHFEYRFSVFDDSMTDPLNPRTLTGSGNLPSVLTTPGWKEPSHLREPTGRRGRLETFTWGSAVLRNEREVTIYLPPGYEAGEKRYPLVVVNYGNQALDQGKWADSLDNLVGKSVAALIAAFVPRVSFDEYGPGVTQFTDAIAQELIPEVDRRYRTLPGAENRAMTGVASGGFATAFLALRKPAVVGKVAVQSFYFRNEAEDELRSMIAHGKNEQKASFYVEWSMNDLRARPGMHSEEHSRELAALLRDKGYRVVVHEVSDGAGWGSWRARNDRILENFFPLP
ncbi:MAG: esterase family protein [bacterium]|nr:esterase family protein [bacterium]